MLAFHSWGQVARRLPRSAFFCSANGCTAVSRMVLTLPVLRPSWRNVSDIGKRIGERIRDLRNHQAQPWTQKELASKARISVSYLSMIERGQRVPPMHT